MSLFAATRTLFQVDNKNQFVPYNDERQARERRGIETKCDSRSRVR